MNHSELNKMLLNAGRSIDFDSILSFPGAGSHKQVLNFSDKIRGQLLDEFCLLGFSDRVAFVKALAVYENSVGGLGSVTALHRILPLMPDDNHILLDWILSNTRSYSHYTYGAKSYADLMAIRNLHSLRVIENLRKEYVRAEQARSRRAVRATHNLFNAVRRGDIRAVHSLLKNGASPHLISHKPQPAHESSVPDRGMQ
jgi:hypothetical protein